MKRFFYCLPWQNRQFNKRQSLGQPEKVATTVAVKSVTDTTSSIPFTDNAEPLTVPSTSDELSLNNEVGDPQKVAVKKCEEDDSLDGYKSKNLKSRSRSNGKSKARHSDSSKVSEENRPSVSASASAKRVELGDDFSTKYNIVLFFVTCLPFAATVYLGYHGSKALGPWIVVSVCHFLYVGLTYRGAPEITGCREIQVVHRDGPIVRYIGDTVRRYFNGSIIKECDLDPKGAKCMHPMILARILLIFFLFTYF